MISSKYLATLATLLLVFLPSGSQARTAFEKMTDVDYIGETYYTIRNLSLYECQGWCREEVECQAASFSFVANALGQQETVCLLQNSTQANNPTAKPVRALHQYYMVKMSIRSDKVCKRPWNFERVPNSIIQGNDRALIFTSTKEACLAACLNERNFVCRSAEYNYVTLQCRLSDYDRRTVQDNLQPVTLVEAQGVDYFENLCLSHENACAKERSYQLPRFGIPAQKVAAHVKTQFYVDKELIANSANACGRACRAEVEFLCRSFLYLGPPTGKDYNCKLYHMDHWTLPDGVSAFLNSNSNSISDGTRIGNFYENRCRRQLSVDNGGVIDNDLGINDNGLDNVNNGNDASNPQISADGSSGNQVDTASSDINDASEIVSETGTVINGGSTNGGGSSSSNAGGFDSNGGIIFDNNFDNSNLDPDINCDRLGTCYDVSVHCKDTRIVVNVNTNKPFSGRIYALGRSETCNVDVINSDSFRLDLTMSGQDCNTQSVAGVYTNTVVVQRHSVVMTKADKIYKVRCTYDTTSRNITFGMMPIRDPDMISITSAPEAPAPRIRILDSREQEVETVRIGDRLTFRIEIPDKTPYGIFARSCVAMAKDARSTFPIIDDEGCPVDPAIFPRFTPEGNALASVYEAFRFTESYGVIFQCNVKYCLGPCQPVSCNYGRDKFESWGRKRRKRREVQVPANVIDTNNEVDALMRLSHEIVVLDLGDEQTNPFDFDAPSTYRNGTNSKVSPMDWNSGGGGGAGASFISTADCSDSTSVMALAVACSLLIILYCGTLLCFCLRKSGLNTYAGADHHPKIVLPPTHIPGRSNSSSLSGSTTSFGMMTHDYVR